ncbi:MAG: hypothetical protein Q8865_08495, partial [Bacillota bacterium]|nr:hypothetical protein [Bacillota bacterium]
YTYQLTLSNTDIVELGRDDNVTVNTNGQVLTDVENNKLPAVMHSSKSSSSSSSSSKKSTTTKKSTTSKSAPSVSSSEKAEDKSDDSINDADGADVEKPSTQTTETPQTPKTAESAPAETSKPADSAASEKPIIAVNYCIDRFKINGIVSSLEDLGYKVKCNPISIDFDSSSIIFYNRKVDASAVKALLPNASAKNDTSASSDVAAELFVGNDFIA